MKDFATHERFASGLSDEAANASVEVLNKNLPLVIDLELSVKQAHWTLRGTNYIGVHELLDTTAGNLREVLDTIAERTVILGGVPNGVSQHVASATSLPEYPVKIASVQEHVRELTDRYKIVAASLREAITVAGDAGDEDTADLFTEASRIIDKDTWFIGSNLETN
ncbi:DNA starvation/stationary phase protection protein Dps [Thioclava sp. SK-1]|uniref:DNA starvation/stationary phase protection protein Dps n=1 Tax=Thioclava sp. SK-1 TaxID=1889770 RepID=UPI000825E95C|nr:DNA starvation/stationary phase protection protein Dps [Thioclava sp. SK-1]OCX67282.1 DNA starvation/stationary phase protection protein Dps [Thioclava sp. SK-1]